MWIQRVPKPFIGPHYHISSKVYRKRMLARNAPSLHVAVEAFPGKKYPRTNVVCSYGIP